MKVFTLSTDRDRLLAYYQLTKPGIVRGNAVTAVAGFFLASGVMARRGVLGQAGVAVVGPDIAWVRLLAMLIGLSLIIASACVCNNYMDQAIDQAMARTRTRASATGLITTRHGLLYAGLLGLAGTLTLLHYTNMLAAGLGIFGFIAYVFIYGYAKRRSVHGTVIGSISGAIPPLVGYAAVGGQLGIAALILFLIVVFWQMPHFYAIAMFRLEDYRAGGVPVLPLQRGMVVTKHHVIAYIAAFGLASLSLTIFGYTGYVYLAAALLLSSIWFQRGLRGLTLRDTAADIRWARQLFTFSLVTISGLCLAIILDVLV